MRTIAIALLLSLGVASAAASAEPPHQVRLTPNEIAALPSESGGVGTSGLPAVVTTVLFGDPQRPGLYTIQLKLAPNTTIQAHTHKDTRTASVVAGLWYFGYGTKNKSELLRPLPQGSFYTEPAGQPHFARTGPEGAQVLITGYGPSDTVYVNQKTGGD
jgi:quercetin dioxygenase-like cupin family protein